MRVSIFGLSRVYYERPMVIDSVNLKLRQIARFSSNMILDEISSSKCCLHEERPLYQKHMVTSHFSWWQPSQSFILRLVHNQFGATDAPILDFGQKDC